MFILPFRCRVWSRLVVMLMLAALSVRGSGEADSHGMPDPREPGATLRILTPEVLELEIIEGRAPGAGAEAERPRPWNWVIPASAVKAPEPAQFAVRVAGEQVAVTDVGIKRRAVHAPLAGGELRVGTWVYLKLARPVPVDATVVVENPGAALWKEGERRFEARADARRWSPAIHVNQEGYLPALSKKAMVGYYLGSLGELAIPEGTRYQVIDREGRVVLEERLRLRPERGYNYSPAPYQQVHEADFTAVRAPGEYRLVVPGLGASVAFRIAEDVAIAYARAFALGIYHQRCGADNALPFTRFTHAACHVAPARVPVPAEEFAFTWRTLASRSGDAAGKDADIGPPLADAGAQLYPFVRRGEVAAQGGHHDAGDYSKYTTNSASFIHFLVFAVDVIPGAAESDNLGLPESGDGIPDLLQEAKWEADFLARLQDDDGGFYFLVYPRDRAYESDALPDAGEPQVVWPKNTAATAAAVAALAQAGSSPQFRKHYPKEAAEYLERAKKGWGFLRAALERHGPRRSYQRFTHYGDSHRHDDELAWAAAELFLATGDEEYHRKFREWCDPADARTRRWGWWRLNESWGHAIRSYAFAVRSGRVKAGTIDAALEARCRREVEAAGRDVLRATDESAYGTNLPAQTKRMRGGGWHFSLDQAFDLVTASLLDYPRQDDPRPAFLEAYVSALNYEAGTNPVNMSYVTGMGRRQPREIVHQYAANDRRRLPPPGLPVGNIQTGQPFLAPYKSELGALSYPEDGAVQAPYAYYDRWTDTHNVSTEFVIVNQARALAGLVWLAAQTPPGREAWRPEKVTIAGLPDKAPTGEPVQVRLEAPRGLDLERAEIRWEAAGGVMGRGRTFSFTPQAHGRPWVEAEVRWPDGRRVFAAAEFEADNGRAMVSVKTLEAVASVEKGSHAVFEFRRTGDLSAPLTVRFVLQGTAHKWSDYRRPEGDMPVEMVIPAGSESVKMSIRAMAEGLGSDTRELVIVVRPHEDYNVGPAREARAKLVGRN